MSFYRIYNYPLRQKQFRHIKFYRDRYLAPISSQNEDDTKESTETTLEKERTEDEKIIESNNNSIIEKVKQLEKRDENISRARRTIRDLILCNKFDYFCTFTFNAEKVDRYDFKKCKKRITELFKNYKNRFAPDFRYLVVPEFHKDGAVHFHGMVSGIRKGDFSVPEYIWKRDRVNDQLLIIPNTKKYVDWGYYSQKLGFFSCSKVRHYERCAMYVSKYITKELMILPLGQRVFMASKGLNRPELIFDEDGIPLVLSPDFENDFCSIVDDETTLGLLPDWYGEQCSELYDDELNVSDLAYEQILQEDMLTYEQLKLSYK